MIPRRKYSDSVDLSILGFGGITLVGMEQKRADALVRDAVEAGVNYFDVAPFYGSGEAEQKLGVSLAPFRKTVFLACKTLERSAGAALRELEHSLRQLRTDHFDLYQFHAVSSVEEVEEIFAPEGALETFLMARKQGKVRYIGFSAHSVPAALAMLDRFVFDSVLFPVNFVCFARGDFGPQVLEKAKEHKSARLALKAMALRPWRRGESKKYPNCWYRPIEDRELALEALRFTLSERVVSALPPGDERLFRMALELAPEITPMTHDERESLFCRARGSRPIFRYTGA